MAVKQFDVTQGGLKNYVQELRGYIHLRKAWGELVPKPLFLSESWSGNVKFLGLELGRSPDVTELPKVRDDLKRIQERLIDEFGFEQLDADSCNTIYLPGNDRVKEEHLVAIDLEAHRILT